MANLNVAKLINMGLSLLVATVLVDQGYDTPAKIKALSKRDLEKVVGKAPAGVVSGLLGPDRGKAKV